MSHVEFTEENFSITVDDQNPAVEIKYQGVNALRIAELETQVEQLDIDVNLALVNLQATTGGGLASLNTALTSLTSLVNAQGVDIAEEEAARIAADALIVADRLAGDNALDAAITAETAARVAADEAEVIARNAAIAAVAPPLEADIAALEASVAGLTGTVSAVSASQATLVTTVADLSTDFTALDASFTALTADFATTEAAVLAESAARAASEAAIIASIPTDHDQLAGLGDDDHTQYHNDTRGDARYVQLADLDEAIDDRVAGLLVPGTNITLTYDDVTDTLTIDAAGGGGGGVVDAEDVTYDNTASGLTAADVKAAIDEIVAGLPRTVYQAADLVITSDNVLQDTDLVIALGVGTYLLELQFSVLSHATPDMEIAQEFSGTLSDIQLNRMITTGSSGNTSHETTLFTGTYTTTSVGTQYWSGILTVSVAGTFKVRARQITSSPTSVTFYAGSFMRAQKVA